MIEVAVAPGRCIVARTAIAAELTVVGLLLLMAVHAFHRDLPISFRSHVTARAGHTGVCVPQREVRGVVIELSGTEFDDVGIAAVMFRVASMALRRRDAGEMPVIAALRRYVPRNIFVAVKAQMRLSLAVAAVVAE